MRAYVAALLCMIAAPLVQAEDLNREQTRIAWSVKCLNDVSDSKEKARAGIIGAALMAVAPKLIEGAVDAAANALKAAGESKSFATSGKTSGEFYSFNAQGDLLLRYGCVTVVRGDFSNPPNQPRSGLSAYAEFIGLKSSSFEFEAKLEPVKGLKFVRLRPVYLKANKFAESSWFSSSERTYTVALSLNVPGGEKPFGSAEFSFPGIEEGMKIEAADWRFANAVSEPIALAPESVDATAVRTGLQGKAAPYLLALDIIESNKKSKVAGQPKVPSLYKSRSVTDVAKLYCDRVEQFNRTRSLPENAKIADERCKYVIENEQENLATVLRTAHFNAERLAWATGLCGDVQKPDGKEERCANFEDPDDLPTATFFTSNATVVETRPGSKFAKFLGEALGAAKTDVSSAIGKKILPSTDEQIAAKDKEGRDARRALTLADLEVTQAEEALAAAIIESKATTITAARIALVKAKIAANDAYRKAGLTSVPYPELD